MVSVVLNTSNNEKNTNYANELGKENTMDNILRELEREEIREYKRELGAYLELIPDHLFYQYFGIYPMTMESYEEIRRDLVGHRFYCLLARFSDRKWVPAKPQP